VWRHHNEGALNGRLEFVRRERLREIADRAGPCRFDSGGDRRVAGHDDNRDRRPPILRHPEEVKAAHLRHHEIGQNDVKRRVRFQCADRIPDGLGLLNGVTFSHQNLLNASAYRSFVIHHQHAHRFRQGEHSNLQFQRSRQRVRLCRPEDF
jgi:hypothetical protein